MVPPDEVLDVVVVVGPIGPEPPRTGPAATPPPAPPPVPTGALIERPPTDGVVVSGKLPYVGSEIV